MACRRPSGPAARAVTGLPRDPRALARWRLHNLGLGGAVQASPADVVHRLGGVQAQDYGPAKWSLGERINGPGAAARNPATDAGIDESFATGSILRTHVLRPTWHFVAPSDIRWLLALTAPRVHALNAYYYRQAELDETILHRSQELLRSALAGKHLTRTEIAAVLSAAGIKASGLRLGYALMNAELNGLICSGPLRGKQHTYVLLDERAPAGVSEPALERDEALARLVRRYFTSHGPATAKDCAYWSSLPVKDITRGLGIVAGELQLEVIDGVQFWFAAPAPARQSARRVHLLQAYDEYLVAYTESKYILDASGAARAQPAEGGTFNHVLIVDSQVAGRWRRTVKKATVLIEVALHAPLGGVWTRALHEAAQRHGQFLGRTATVVTAVKNSTGARR